ncbi:hypothetical protein KR038_000116 [Drosophila bunnanda]|nr:hypothetical protein KR038_000116 [Drosophila bunnanda]
MSGATKENVELLRAVMKHPVLYDRGEENYRKRLPSENSWDMVASEVGGSVEKCKRRWRQLRNDYTRWCNADANRRRQGQRRIAYQLQDEFRFLDRHLNLADSIYDEDRSGSEKDRDSNRDSESRDNTNASVKAEAALDDQPVNDESLADQLLEEKDPSTKDVDKDKTKETPKQKKAAQEKPQEQERGVEEDSYMQSDQEGDDPIDEEHLEDFEYEEEELMQHKEKERNAKDSSTKQSEFFIKQNKEPHLLIIGKKNATLSGGEAPDAESEELNLEDPLDDEIAMDSNINLTTSKMLRRRDSMGSPSRRLRKPKDASITKPTQAQRVTRHQRLKTMTLAAGQSIRSSTSPVKMTPVPRPVGASKTVQLKKSVPLKDGYFSRPSTPLADGRQGPRQSLPQSQSQRQQVMRRLTTSDRPETPPTPPKRGRPAKKIEMMPRLEATQIRQPSPNTPKVVPITKTPSSVANTGSNVANMGINPTIKPTGNLTNRITATTLKPLENVTVMSYSPISSTSHNIAGSSAKPINKSSPSGVATTAAVAALSLPLSTSLLKRCERSTQTECSDIFSDEHFLDMIRPQMKEMNTRQKLHFKQKIFKALMETFDDATDFPEAGELQHLNINTPSAFEHVTTPELRLIRELVSMVIAAKVSPRGTPQQQARPPAKPASQPKEGVSYTAVNIPDSQRVSQTVSIPSHLIQRVYKPSRGAEPTANNAAAPGAEKKMYRFLKTPNGKPNGFSGSLEDLRKNSVDSEHSVVSTVNIPPASPKGATVVAAVRPQGSTINSLFGPSTSVTAVRTGPSLKARALARRYSTCTNQGTLPIPQGLGYPSSLHSDLTLVEANALKRRLAQPMVPPIQRPRFTPGVQQIVTPQGNSLLVRKPIGAGPGNQKQLVSPTGGVVLTPQKTPQITNVQGAAFKDFVQPKPTAVASTVSSGSSTSSASLGSPSAAEGTPQSIALKRSLVVANAKSQLLAESQANKPQQQPQAQKSNTTYASITAATIAADDFSIAHFKPEPVDHIDDQDDILGM